jgi:hypothetical protein
MAKRFQLTDSSPYVMKPIMQNLPDNRVWRHKVNITILSTNLQCRSAGCKPRRFCDHCPKPFCVQVNSRSDFNTERQFIYSWTWFSPQCIQKHILKLFILILGLFPGHIAESNSMRIRSAEHVARDKITFFFIRRGQEPENMPTLICV